MVESAVFLARLDEVYRARSINVVDEYFLEILLNKTVFTSVLFSKKFSLKGLNLLTNIILKLILSDNKMCKIRKVMFPFCTERKYMLLQGAFC